MLDIGWLLGNILGVILILATLGFIIWASTKNAEYYQYDFGASKAVTMWVAIAALLAQLVWNGLWNFPFSMEYHSYQHVSGVVSEVNSRFLKDTDGSVGQKYAVKLKGTGQIYGCQDTRCSLLKPGDHVTLACERQWQYASVPGYDCRYAQ